MKKVFNFSWILCLVAAILLHPMQVIADADARKNEDVCIISIAVDVSGSMKKTDLNRDAVELMKMMMDICDENDYFSLIAYNDDIVYQSGLINTGDMKALDKAKADFDRLVYEGDTDNGLGLLTATKTVTDSNIAYDRASIILISDGNTDLINSPLNRQQADSDADIRTSTELAKNNNITLNVVEYTKEYTDDTTLFSVAASATGGTVTIVNEPMQFVQVVLNMFFNCFNNGKTVFDLHTDAKATGKEKIAFDLTDCAEEYFFFYSQEPISEIDFADENPGCEVIYEDRYFILRVDKEEIQRVKMIYSLRNPCDVLTGTAKVDLPPEQEVVTEVVEIEVERQSQIPVGTDKELACYTAKDRLQVDVSRLFEDDDIVSYSFYDEQSAEHAELLGNVVLIDISGEGQSIITIIATDAVGNTAKANIHIDVTASWRQYTAFIVAGIVLLILLLALVVCGIIVRFVVFGRKKKEQPAIHGYLMARYVDIKTKNSFADVEWDLSRYPPEGVSLQELFQSEGIKEELYGTDKVCFYPAKMKNELILVHCIEGGVFLGNRHVKANTPTVIRHGSRIYVSLAENASEIELTYSGTM